MKVAFNARLLASPDLRGWNRYTLNLLAGLIDHGVRPYLYSDRPIHAAHLRNLPEGSFETRVEAARMSYLRWEQRWIPRQCAIDGVDLCHCPLNFGLPWSSPCPRILTLHDAVDQMYYHPKMSVRRKLGSAHIRSVFQCWVARTRADHVITVSNHAKSDLVNHLGLPAERVTVIYEAADARFHAPVDQASRARLRESLNLSRPYVLYLGGWEARKNVRFLLQAFAEAKLAGVDLVLAGGREEEFAPLREFGSKLGIEPSLRLFGKIGDDDLPALYAEALCFVYPSEYEGFGLQLCEAMAAGCPVLAANATALPEILGSGGETFDLRDTNGLADLLRRVSDECAYRETLSARARERSKDFSWQQTAAQTFEVYRALSRS